MVVANSRCRWSLSHVNFGWGDLGVMVLVDGIAVYVWCINSSHKPAQHDRGRWRTHEVEAEDGKGEGAKEREYAVQDLEGLVQEGGDRWVHEDVEDDVQQPAGREASAYNAQPQLDPEAQHRHSPGIVRILPLARMRCWTHPIASKLSIRHPSSCSREVADRCGLERVRTNVALRNVLPTGCSSNK